MQPPVAAPEFYAAIAAYIVTVVFLVVSSIDLWLQKSKSRWLAVAAWACLVTTFIPGIPFIIWRSYPYLLAWKAVTFLVYPVFQVLSRMFALYALR